MHPDGSQTQDARFTDPVPRELYGGAIVTAIPPQFLDASRVREVPDHQEVFISEATDHSVIIELLDYDTTVPDSEVALHYFNGLVRDNEARDHKVEFVKNIASSDAPHFGDEFPKQLISGTQVIAKFRDTAANLVRVYVAVIRIPQKTTDIVISFNHPLAIDPSSSSAELAPATAQSTDVVVHAIVEHILLTIEIKDWGLFQ